MRKKNPLKMWNKSTVANTYFLATWNVVNNNQEKSSNINLGRKGLIYIDSVVCKILVKKLYKW